ncbi:MAG: hypothetical protein LBT10_06765 [Methanobrevibacter sp.]|jgi:hypothetical protein|nr:hypothetical protein [Methanobrevibacter sp.]
MLTWALVDLKTPSSHFLPPYISLKDFIFGNMTLLASPAIRHCKKRMEIHNLEFGF